MRSIRRDAMLGRAASLALALVLVGAATHLQAAAPDTVQIGLFGEPDFLDPHVASSVGVPIVENMYESLVFTDGETTRIVPVLATSWEVSSNGLEYTFHLRRGVRFHDGTSFDAEAVRFSIERVRSLKTGPYWVLSHVESVEVVDADTLRIRIRPGGPPLLQALTMIKIVSPAAVKAHESGGDWAKAWLNVNSAGTGPYRLVEWRRGDRVVLERFDDYWRGWDGPHFDRAVLRVIPEASTQLLMLERGDLDMAWKLPAESIDRLKKDRRIVVVERPGVRVLFLRMNFAAPPTQDRRVRLAVTYAFDYATFVAATNGTFALPEGPVPAVFLGGQAPAFPYTYDVARARQLLTEAGYSRQNPLRLTIDVLANDDPQLLAAQILQAGLRQTGVAEATIRSNEWGPMIQSMAEWGQTRDPRTARHMFGLYTPPRFPDAYSYLWYMYHKDAQGGSGRNLMYFEDARVDRLIEEAALAQDQATAVEKYREAVRLILDQAPDLIVGTQKKVYAMRADLGGFYVHPTWYPAADLYALYRK